MATQPTLGALDLGSARLDAIQWNAKLGGPNPGNSMQRAIAAMYLREQGQRNFPGEIRWWNRFNGTAGALWGPLFTNEFTSEVKGEASQGADHRAQYPKVVQYGAAVLDPSLPMPAAGGMGSLSPMTLLALGGGALLLLGGGRR